MKRKNGQKSTHAGLPHPNFNKNPNSIIIAGNFTPCEAPYPGNNAASKRFPIKSSIMKEMGGKREKKEEEKNTPKIPHVVKREQPTYCNH